MQLGNELSEGKHPLTASPSPSLDYTQPSIGYSVFIATSIRPHRKQKQIISMSMKILNSSLETLLKNWFPREEHRRF